MKASSSNNTILLCFILIGVLLYVLFSFKSSSVEDMHKLGSGEVRRNPIYSSHQTYWGHPHYRRRHPYRRYPFITYPLHFPSLRHRFPKKGVCEQDCNHTPVSYSYWGVPSDYELQCKTTVDGRPTRACKDMLDSPGSTSFRCERKDISPGRYCMDEID